MPTRSQEWRIDRVCRLKDAVIRDAAEFDGDYGVVTAQTHAWSRLMGEHTQEWVAYHRGERKTPPPYQSLRPTEAAIERARLDLETNKREPTSEEVAEKHARWRRLWARSLAAIIGFQVQQEDAVGEERAWADGIVNDMHAFFAQLRRSMESEHPGMPPIEDIQDSEILRAFLLGEDDDGDDDDHRDENDDEDHPH